MNTPLFLVFDSETTGLPKNWKAPITDVNNWPRCVQLAWQLHDSLGNLVEQKDFIIQPDGFEIPYETEQIHGISTELAQERGVPLEEVAEAFNEALSKTTFIVGHNLGFDVSIMGCEFYRLQKGSPLDKLPILDTCTEKTAQLCELSGGKGGRFKYPSLTELYLYLFKNSFKEAHNATADVEATAQCFLELIRIGLFTKQELNVEASYFESFKSQHPETVKPVGLKHVSFKEEGKKLKSKAAKKNVASNEDVSELQDKTFAHLHCHSQFSILQSTSSIPDLLQATVENQMEAIAITDVGNMLGAFYFTQTFINYNKSIEGNDEKKSIKPIVGSEFYVCTNHLDTSRKDNGFQVVFLAKNKQGYHNLAKLSSISYTDGHYYVPRIDKELIKKHKENLIVLSGNLRGEIPALILNQGKNEAEKMLLWWKEEFGDDFYLEVTRHGQENEDYVNEILIEFSKKHNIKLVATNNTYYTHQSEAEAHDILLCIKDNEKISTPIGNGRGFRYGLPNNEYYFKSQSDMKSLFSDLPEAILSVQEILDKIETYSLARDVLLPKFPIPEKFEHPKDKKDGGVRGENAYLKHITYEGAEKRYGSDLKNEVRERIDFELNTIEKTGYPGYFLIINDLILEAKKMGVSVGPGRGSAAGSVVAYCLDIINIDPLAYNLLFERFLNPDRVSLPDIDIDFDDENRQKVIDFVTQKYGSEQVAQIVTYGTMAAKSSIRDVARVLDLPLPIADKLSKLVPNVKLKDIFGDSEKSKKKIKSLRSDDLEKVKKLKEIADSDTPEGKTLKQAISVEGSLRNIGTHACGVIISPQKITNLIPVTKTRGDEMIITQFDNNVVEKAGLLKMDFLGLKTLSLIREVTKIIKAIHGVDLNPDEFPLDDIKTYELFQRGDTVGIFQYESAGMQKHLSALKPTQFEDLIAMNALYRPGPMEYIPQFIKRKHGKEVIRYDLPIMEEILKETYGITVYQEQVMLLSQLIANFTKGEADVLRKGMGKKIPSMLQELKPKFINGGIKNQHPKDVLEKIWNDWYAFAEYAFNKSHATCYAYLAYQTAYLKANYTKEFMASVLSSNMSNIKQIRFFMEECKRLSIPVLGPDVNESFYRFSVNKSGSIRFGIGAIKGVGGPAVTSIIEERQKEGPFTSMFDMAKRVNLRNINKKAFEGLILAGALDSFSNAHRAQYFKIDEKEETYIEKILRLGSKFQLDKNSSQLSLFGGDDLIEIVKPELPITAEWSTIEKLTREKEMVGIYISGHPLNDYRHEVNNFCNVSLQKLSASELKENQKLSIAGVVTEVYHRVSKSGKGWGQFILEDFTGSYEFKIFSEEYLKFKHFLIENSFLYVKLFTKRNWNDEITLSFTSFKLLQEILSANTSKITIYKNLKDLDDNFINTIEQLTETHKGKKKLEFKVFDNSNSLSLLSNTKQVSVSKNMLAYLDSENIMFKLS